VNLSILAHRVQRLAVDNAPTILTSLGAVGLVTTAVLTGKATFKYMKVLADEGYYDRSYKFERSKKEHFKKAWKCFIPAVGTGALSLAAIIGANHISYRRAVALASAYTIAQEGFKEYKDQVIEKLGEKKEQTVRDAVTQDRIAKNPPPSSEIFFVEGNNVVCGDAWSGRYFISSQNKIEKAVNEANAEIIKFDYISLTDLWSKLGLEPTSESDEVGWNTDNLIEITYSWGPTTDGRPCMMVDFGKTVPLRGVYSFR
jgi:hypothetical protein